MFLLVKNKTTTKLNYYPQLSPMSEIKQISQIIYDELFTKFPLTYFITSTTLTLYFKLSIETILIFYKLLILLKTLTTCHTTNKQSYNDDV